MRKASLKALRGATGEFYGLEKSEPALCTVGGHEQKGATRKGALPLVPVVVLLVALALAVALAGFAVQPAEAQTAGGPVVAWGGVNEFGQLNVPSNLSGVKAISAGGVHNLALKEDGTVVAWGGNYYGQIGVPEGLSGVKAISAGLSHSLALKEDGTVVAWRGYNAYGQGSVPSNLSGVKAISAGTYHNLALKEDGTVVAWGANGLGQTTVPTGLGGVKAVSAGGSHSLALKEDGTVVAWGRNAEGQSSVPSGLSGVKAISAGELHSLALKEDGTVVAWGDNRFDHGSVPYDLGGITAIDASVYHNLALDASAPGPITSFAAIADDGKVSLSWKNPSDTDFQTVRVLRSTTGTATSPEPSAQQTQIYEGTVQSYEDTNLANGTTYYYTAFAKDEVGNWSAGATQSANPADATAPTIDSVTPAARPKPAKSTNVTATFSEAMDEGSLKASGTFTLLQKGKSTPVAASVSYDAATKKVTLTPSKRLKSGETYKVMVTRGAKDAAGNPLAAAKVWSFTIKQ